ncbi:MAG: rhomboid family intramembrane serine protease [Hymenobacteraceae bacterium]|nr:rhomboid family intramembrane serine protease [Hymenobacteraceae bacterium]
MFNLTPVVRVLLALNVVVLLLQSAGLVPGEVFALHAFASPLFRPWQLLTYMFMHGGWGHIISNMLSLVIFGAMLEQHWGAKRFLTFYLVCGLGAGLLYDGIRGWEMHQLRVAADTFTAAPTAINFDRFTDDFGGDSYEYEPLTRALKAAPGDAGLQQAGLKVVTEITTYIITYSSMLGASGAVFGILFAFGYLFPNTKMFIFPLPIALEAKYLVFLYGAYELFRGVHRTPGDNVAHFAHLGGMLIALLLLKYWEKRSPDFY